MQEGGTPAQVLKEESRQGDRVAVEAGTVPRRRGEQTDGKQTQAAGSIGDGKPPSDGFYLPSEVRSNTSGRIGETGVSGLREGWGE